MPIVNFTLYGLTQSAYGARMLPLDVPPGLTVRAAQERLLAIIPLGGQAIALATGSRVLAPDDILPLDEELAVLPPVCGG